MEDITEADYTQSKSVSKDFETKYLGEYHDLHVFENFRNVCNKLCEFHTAKFLSASGSA